MKMKNLMVRTLSGLVLVAVFVGAVLGSQWSFGALLLLILVGGQTEFYKLAREIGLSPQRWMGLAVGVLLECQAQGIAVPQEIAIGGFHGLEIGRARLQKIASVITPRYDIGKTASEILIARLAGKDAPDSVNLAYQIYYGDTL